MSRIATPERIEDVSQAAQPLLQNLREQLGRVPNMLRMMANSPAALQGYLSLAGALDEGSITPATRKRIALAVAEINGCDYCLSASIYSGRQAGLDNAEMTANRSGASNDMHADAAVRFAAQITQKRGHVSDADLRAFQAEGYTDAQVLEVTMLVALCTLANYVNEVTGTDIDCPVVHKRAVTRVSS